MKKESFIMILKSYHDVCIHMSNLHDIGFNFLENKRFPIDDLITSIFSQSILSHYKDEGLDWITWYLFEFVRSPFDAKSDKDFMYPDREPAAWDSDKAPICFNIDTLYDYVNDNCKLENNNDGSEIKSSPL
jgi:hypothetical protein